MSGDLLRRRDQIHQVEKCEESGERKRRRRGKK